MEEKKLLNEEELEIASGTAVGADTNGTTVNEPTAAASEYRYYKRQYKYYDKNAHPYRHADFYPGDAVELLTDNAVAGAVAGTAEDDVPNGKDRIMQRGIAMIITGTSEGFTESAESADDDTAHYGSRGANGVVLIT